MRLFRWAMKQRLARPARYYGGDGTWHRTGHIDVETYEGKVVAVWFRCQALPFQQMAVEYQRGEEMDRLYAQGVGCAVTGVEVLDEPAEEPG